MLFVVSGQPAYPCLVSACHLEVVSKAKPYHDDCRLDCVNGISLWWMIADRQAACLHFQYLQNIPAHDADVNRLMSLVSETIHITM